MRDEKNRRIKAPAALLSQEVSFLAMKWASVVGVNAGPNQKAKITESLLKHYK